MEREKSFYEKPELTEHKNLNEITKGGVSENNNIT